MSIKKLIEGGFFFSFFASSSFRQSISVNAFTGQIFDLFQFPFNLPYSSHFGQPGASPSLKTFW
jgi:hypothetical protein